MFAFPRELRLLTPESFSFVFQKPYRAYSPYITILARKNALEYPRVGFAISKKNIKFASDRNRIKRIVRESFRLHRHQLPYMDFVITAKKAAVELDNNAVRAALDKLWQRYS